MIVKTWAATSATDPIGATEHTQRPYVTKHDFISDFYVVHPKGGKDYQGPNSPQHFVQDGISGLEM